MSGARVVPTHDHDRQTANGGGGGDGDSGGNAPPQRHSNLYVCGLPTGFTSRDVTALFEPHGQVESARVMQVSQAPSSSVGGLLYFGTRTGAQS
eukprot:363231-Chlamydomonas_euryale.AAC.7